ncbi:MAG: hypothetical protein JWN22_238 [Nocardioides sp.]|jgi:hypothetical protein|nr:hypothetical protein [Nocardioides sp.]
MTFEHAQTVTTTASPADVWALWSDPGCWPRWDPAVQQVAFEGHFGEGAGGTMLLTAGIEAPFVLKIVEHRKRYVDRLTLGDLVVEIDHEVRPTEGGAEITVLTMVHGVGADEVGPMVTADTPVALAALVRMAEGR